MITKLEVHGSELALVIDQALLDQLKIDEGTKLDVTTDGAKVIITPLDEGDRGHTVSVMLADINARYGNALKNLAE
jgi:antitoxin component of MazEF toxin-antitoxin module